MLWECLANACGAAEDRVSSSIDVRTFPLTIGLKRCYARHGKTETNRNENVAARVYYGGGSAIARILKKTEINKNQKRKIKRKKRKSLWYCCRHAVNNKGVFMGPVSGVRGGGVATGAVGRAKDTRTPSIMKYETIFHGRAGKRDRNILRARGDKPTRRFAVFFPPLPPHPTPRILYLYVCFFFLVPLTR